MVAGDDDDLALGPERGGEITQDRVGERERLRRTRLEQFDDVTEQHQSLDVGERRNKAGPRDRRAQHVPPDLPAQVQVRDDERARHCGASSRHRPSNTSPTAGSSRPLSACGGVAQW